MYVWRKSAHCVVNKRPLFKMGAPMDLRALEILRNLVDGSSRIHLVRRVDLEKSPIGFQKAVILAITYVTPRTTGHEIGFVG